MTDQTFAAPMLEAMAPVLGPHVTNIFQLMAIAEQEIASAKKRHPEESEQIDRAFSVLCPRMNLFGGIAQQVYRHHAVELIDRVRVGGDTTLGTRAEVLCLFSESAFVSPLVPSAMCLMEMLLTEICPDWKPPAGDTWIAQEEWPGQCESILADCRKRLSDPSRTVRTQRGAEHE